MRILKLLIALLPIHLGLGFTQMVVSYYAGDIADYGAAGFASHTPLGPFFELQEELPQMGEGGLSNFRGAFDLPIKTGSTINGLASFGYGFLQEIQPDDGLVYMVVMTIRMISVLMWVGAAFALLYLLFDSNLLTSKFGLTIVGLGVGLGGLSALGAAFG